MAPLLNGDPDLRKQYFDELVDRLMILSYSTRRKFYSNLIRRIEGGEIGDLIAGDIEGLFHKHMILAYKNKILKYTTSKPYFSFSDIYKMFNSTERKLFSLDEMKSIFQDTIKKIDEVHVHMYNGKRICCVGMKEECIKYYKFKRIF